LRLQALDFRRQLLQFALFAVAQLLARTGAVADNSAAATAARCCTQSE
jgi:hypothetical protein